MLGYLTCTTYNDWNTGNTSANQVMDDLQTGHDGLLFNHGSIHCQNMKKRKCLMTCVIRK